jgi:hypothetical protein
MVTDGIPEWSRDGLLSSDGEKHENRNNAARGILTTLSPVG